MKYVIFILACAGFSALAADTPATTNAPANQTSATNKTTAAAAGVATNTAPRTPAQAGAHGAAKNEAHAKSSITFNFEKTAPMPYTDFPKVELRSPNLATYIGLQYGPEKDAIAYICFDTEKPEKIHDRAFLYLPASTNATKTASVHGRGEDVKLAQGVKPPKDKPQKFVFPELHTKFGDTDFIYKLIVTYGVEQKANVFLDAEVTMKEPKGRSVFALHGSLSNIAVPVPNEIKVLPLLGKPELHIHKDLKVNPPWVRPFLSVTNLFYIEPQNGMEDAFEMEVKMHSEDGSGKTVEKGKVPVKFPPHSSYGDGGVGESFQLRNVRPGNTYDVEATIRLGPLGDLEGTESVELVGKLGGPGKHDAPGKNKK